MNHSSHQVCTVTNPGLEKSLNSSSFHILLAQGHGLLVLANDLVTRWLAWNLTCPLDKWKLKRYLPNKEIYFSQMTQQGFSRALQPLVGFSPMVSKGMMNPIKGFWVQFLSRSKIFSLPRKVPWFPLPRPVKTGERNGQFNFFSPYFFPYFSPSSLIFSAVSPFSLIFHLSPW